MKLKFIFLQLLLCLSVNSFAQPTGYIGVRARYTDTRLVDDFPNPPKRQNRLVLSFYDIDQLGNYIPTTVSNYDIYIYETGFQLGHGSHFDSAFNNYPGYAYTAPRVVAYNCTMGPSYIDCNPNITIHYVANGHELDCGWLTVSYWTSYAPEDPVYEHFSAPNVCLPYYDFTHPFGFVPGNVNFGGSGIGGGPYDYYNLSCGGPLQLVRRARLAHDTATSILISLPVRFANVAGTIDVRDRATISFSNMTETEVLRYEIERSDDGISFSTIGTLLPLYNTGGRADYNHSLLQIDFRNYYRVKAIERNGTVFYSTVISLNKLIKPSSFSVFPNPVTDGLLTVRLSNAESGRYILSVISSTHQFLRQKLINHSSGDLSYSYDLKGLPRGVYQLVLQNSTQRYSQKVIYVY